MDISSNYKGYVDTIVEIKDTLKKMCETEDENFKINESPYVGKYDFVLNYNGYKIDGYITLVSILKQKFSREYAEMPIQDVINDVVNFVAYKALCSKIASSFDK